MRSTDLKVGDFVQLGSEELGGYRRVEVVEVDEGGFRVKWYTPEGVGPHFAVLPHGTFPRNTLRKVEYADERAGQHESYWKTHPDFTGKYGDI